MMLKRSLLGVFVFWGSIAIAVESIPSGKIEGRAPVANSVQISTMPVPQVNAKLTGSYVYDDADGDVESGSTLRWLINSNEVGVGSVYEPLVSGTYTLEVTPRSQPPADPDVGLAATAQVVVEPGFYRNAGTNLYLHDEAKAYCEGQGGRLPTLSELLGIVSAYTSPGNDRDMCTIHGWAMMSVCGGEVDSYWTDDWDSSKGHYRLANLYLGEEDPNHNQTLYHAACVMP